MKMMTMLLRFLIATAVVVVAVPTSSDGSATGATNSSTNSFFRGGAVSSIPYGVNGSTTTTASSSTSTTFSRTTKLEEKAAQYERQARRDLNVISSDDVRRTPFEVEVEGRTSIPYNIVNGTTFPLFGGISGITYDHDKRVYYALTNDAINLTTLTFLFDNNRNNITTNNITTSNSTTGSGSSSSSSTSSSQGSFAGILDAPTTGEFPGFNPGDNPDNNGIRRQRQRQRQRQLQQSDLMQGIPIRVRLPTPTPTPAPTPAPTPSVCADIPLSLCDRRPRFYTLDFDSRGNAEILDVTYLKDAEGQEYGVGEVVPQAIVYCKGQIIISLDVGPNSYPDHPEPTTNFNANVTTSFATTAATATASTATANRRAEIVQFSSSGQYQFNYTYPDYFDLPTGGFTALTVNPNEDILYAATARGMKNDPPNFVRIVEFDMRGTRQSGKQYVYEADQNLVGMLSLDENGGFAMLERSNVIPRYNPNYRPPTTTLTETTASSTTSSTTSAVNAAEDEDEDETVPTFFSSGASVSRNDEPNWQGYDVTMYYARILDALNVESVPALRAGGTVSLQTMKRRNIYEWKNVTKFEAMGPDGDGPDRRRQSRQLTEGPPKKYEIDLMIMSDNQFQVGLDTDVLQVELDLHETPIVQPEEQTEDVIGDDGTSESSRALDPAIWIHPDKSEDSLVLGALSNRDIGVYDLEGNLKQRISNEGGIAMGIDVMYAFQFTDSEFIDVALVTDATNNRVNCYMIRKSEDTDILWGITDLSNMPTINDPTAISVYHSPYTGKQYAFVLSNGGDQVRQLELIATNDQIGGRIVREFGLPVASSAGGLVVDTELGYLYVSIQNDQDKAILKYDAEPDEYEDHNNYPQTVVNGDERFFEQGHDIEGMTLYYGDRGQGYLVVSVSGDSTFVVLEREKNNDYFDSFTIGANREKGIDKVDNSQGIAITNVRLGSDDFRCGLFVVQDSDNEPTTIVVDDPINTGNNGATTQLINSNTNFKLVPFEELAQNLYYFLDIDTHSWNPRRFSSVVWINCLAQDIYSALNLDRLSGRDTEKLLDYLNDAVKALYPRSAKKQQMISLINPYDNDVPNRRHLLGMDLTTEEKRLATRRRLQEDLEMITEEERRELKRTDCRRRRHLTQSINVDEAKDEIEEFIEHLERLKWVDRVREDDFNVWKGLAQAIRDNIPDEA